MIAYERGRNKQHGEEQQPTAQKHGGKEAILKLAQAVAQDADEPQEGDAGERHHVEGKSNGVQTRMLSHALLQRIRRHGKPDEHKAGDEQNRKDDAGNVAAAWASSGARGLSPIPASRLPRMTAGERDAGASQPQAEG